MYDYLPIRPGIGMGPIILGMQPDIIHRVFPEPACYEDWMGGNLNDSLLFHGLILRFSACDSCTPLPESTLIQIIIYQREDVTLFAHPLRAWTKTSLMHTLHAQGFIIHTPPNGDIEVPNQLCLSFDDAEQLVWVAIP